MLLPFPEQLRVDPLKITGYLLSEANSRGKATFFLRMGFHPDRWQELAEAIKAQARTHRVISQLDSPYGTRYGVDGELVTPDGRQPRPRIRTVWILEAGSQIPRLITAHPV